MGSLHCTLKVVGKEPLNLNYLTVPTVPVPASVPGKTVPTAPVSGSGSDLHHPAKLQKRPFVHNSVSFLQRKSETPVCS